MPHIALIFAALIWGSAPATIKRVLEEIPLFDAAAFRFALAAAALWLAAALAGRLARVAVVGWRPFLAGLVDPGVISLMVYHGIQMTTAIHTSVIFALMPLVSSFFGRVVLKETASVAVVIGSFVALFGIGLLVTGRPPGGEPTLAGDLIVVAAVFVICAAQLLLRKVARAHNEPIIATATMMTGATATGFLAWLVLAGDHDLAWTATVPFDAVVLFVYSALVMSAGGFFLYNYALRHLPVGRVSLYGVLEGPSGVAVAWILLNETATVQELSGIALAILGIAIPAFLRRPSGNAVAHG